MKRSMTATGFLLCGLILLSGCAGKCCDPASSKCSGRRGPTSCVTNSRGWTHYGDSMKQVDRRNVCVEYVLANIDKYDGKFARVAGTVDSVCANKGCWLRLTGPNKSDTLFVKFTCPVKGRLVPMSAAGKLAVVEGTIDVKTISQEEARHYLEDSGAPQAKIDEIVGPQKQIQLNSPAALIESAKAPTE